MESYYREAHRHPDRILRRIDYRAERVKTTANEQTAYGGYYRVKKQNTAVAKEHNHPREKTDVKGEESVVVCFCSCVCVLSSLLPILNPIWFCILNQDRLDINRVYGLCTLLVVSWTRQMSFC